MNAPDFTVLNPNKVDEKITHSGEFYKPAHCYFCGNTNVELKRLGNPDAGPNDYTKVWLCPTDLEKMQTIGKNSKAFMIISE